MGRTTVGSRAWTHGNGKVSSADGFLIGASLAPLPALAVGLIVMSGAGIPPGVWLQNAAAAGLGLICVRGLELAHREGPGRGRAATWTIVAALPLLAATLPSPGAEGVHRWLPLGPLRLHAAAFVLPALLVALGRVGGRVSAGVALLTLFVLILQPDAAQAVSFGVAWIVVVSVRRPGVPGAVVMGVGVVALASTVRPGFLDPVPHVEGIVGLAAGQGTVLAWAAVLSLVAMPLALIRHPDRSVGMGLATYVAGTLIAPWLGPYPVPVLGYGVAPIVGYYFGLAAMVLTSPPDRSEPLPVG